jgi:hypothetical protein
MNQQQLIGLVRRYVKESWSREERLVKHGSAYYSRKAEFDGALKALALLEALAYQQQQEQPSLIGEPKP